MINQFKFKSRVRVRQGEDTQQGDAGRGCFLDVTRGGSSLFCLYLSTPRLTLMLCSSLRPPAFSSGLGAMCYVLYACWPPIFGLTQPILGVPLPTPPLPSFYCV